MEDAEDADDGAALYSAAVSTLQQTLQHLSTDTTLKLLQS